MKVCFLVPDGVGVRNYLYSDLIGELVKNGHSIVLWHNLDARVINETERIHQVVLEKKTLYTLPEGPVITLLREATTYARLKLNAALVDNDTILDNWNMNRGTYSRRILYRMAVFMAWFITCYETVHSLERFMFWLLRRTRIVKRYKKTLDEMKPDLLFCTHQRAVQMTPIFLAAKALGITSATAIFSWDNLPKARLPYRADHYFVWSDYMKKEMRTFYTEINTQSIHITGTPQFDFYYKKHLILKKEDFARKYGLDSQKKWICFSGDDTKTSPCDPQYLAQVAEALANESDIQIIFRQVPVEDTFRYEQVLRKNHHVIHINPHWYSGKTWSGFYPAYSDVGLLVNIAYHSKLVINIGSTMAFDFAMFDRPALYLNYELNGNCNWTPTNVYRFQHFRSMNGLNPVGWVNFSTEMADKVLKAIENPSIVGPDRQKWLKRIIQPHPEQSASTRIAKTMERIVRQNSIDKN